MKKRVSIAIGVVAALAPVAAIVWVALLDTPQASAQEVVEGACAKAVATDYFDLTVRMKANPDGGDAERYYDAKVSVAGIAYQLEVQGVIDRPVHVTGIYVDGVGYSREGTGAWQVDKSASHRLVSYFFGFTPTEAGWSVCPNLEQAEKVGEEVVQGITTTGYTTSISNDVLPDSAKERLVTTRWDYWVDETGQLVQLGRIERRPPQDGRAIGGTWTTTISGVGETNTITAPTIPQP